MNNISKIKIGNIELPHNVVLAPMSGVTDLPFRKLVRTFSKGLIVSEMVASRAMIIQTKQSMQKSAILDDNIGACVQIAGCDPDIIAEAAKMNEDMGAKIIDLNFGCPAKQVVGGYAGSALMRDEKLSKEIMEKTVRSVKIPVTLKMRMGWDENSKNAPTLAKIAYESGIQMITVHGRTRAQFYSGTADWEFVSKIKEVSILPLIVNGDINSCQTAVVSLIKSKADGVMIGRGAYGKPWIISQIAHYLETNEVKAPPTLSEQLNIILTHYDDALEHYGVEAGLKIMRKHLGWYSSGLPNSAEFRGNINLLTEAQDVKQRIKEFYSKTIEIIELSEPIYV